MSNFEPKLNKATDEQLNLWINEYDFRVVPLASDELTRRALSKLRETIMMFNEISTKQTFKMINLTKWIVVLTVAMLLGLIIQITLLIK